MDNLKRKIFKEFQMNKNQNETGISRGSGGKRPIFYSTETSFSPPTDVWESENEIYIMMEIAGLDLNDLDIHYSSGKLLIEGQRRESASERQSSIIQFHKKEIDYGTFRVKIKMNSRIEESGIFAGYKDGILSIILKKDTEGRKTGSIRIPVERN